MNKRSPTVLVTGGAGYIGSHAVKALKEAGFRVVVLDNLLNGNREVVEKVLQVKLIAGETNDRFLLDNLFKHYSFDAVMHFASRISVEESVSRPADYYRDVVRTLNLLGAMVAANVKYFIFSSSCAIYGLPEFTPLTENHPQEPINPYGRSKLMIEKMLEDFDKAYGLKSVRFRYFNAAGADPSGKFGEDHNPETHLIPLVLSAAITGKKPVFVYGTDYPTPDGTCVRDFVHVSDLASAHLY